MKGRIKIDKNNKPTLLIQNRKQRRLLEKSLSGKGKTKEELNSLIETINKVRGFNVGNLSKFKEYLLEGDKVKLNIEKIKSHPNWEKNNHKYKKFVEDNEDVIFTVEYDKNRNDKPSIVCLVEDTSDHKWLWSDVDLLVLDDDGKFKEMYTIIERE